MNYLLRKSIAGPLLAVALAFGFVVWISLSVVGEVLRLRDGVEEKHEFLLSLVSILALATDAETGQRGFILTGEDAYLEPYLAARAAVDAELRRARDLGGAAEGKALDNLAALIAQRNEVLSQQIQLSREQGWAPAVEAVRTGRAKAAMDRIRVAIAGLRKSGNGALEQNRRDVHRALERAIVAGIGGTAICALLFTFVFYRISREMVRRDTAEAALRGIQGELEHRVAVRTEELRRAEEEARLAGQKAETANEAKSEFLSRVSHELRTPLNAILGFGQLMEMDLPSSGEQSSNLQHIMRGGRHLLTLVDELLDLTAVEAGHLAMSVEPVLIEEAVLEAVQMITPQARNGQIRVTFHPAALSGVHVYADRQRLRQVFLNLLSNAVKFNRVGGTVDVEGEVVGEGRFRINFKDTGVGISTEDAMRLFAPFERLNNRETIAEGTGLGLSLSKRLIMAMGGTIGVGSEAGLGSTFWVELLFAKTPPAPTLPASTGTESAPGNLSGKTILYIEDNLANVKLVEQILKDRPGTTLLSSMQGSIGLELARTRSPDLIVLDLHLPDIGGQEILRRLRSEPGTRETPVIILSADAIPHRMNRLLDSGAQAYLAKPLNVREFLQLLDRTLADGRGD